MRVVILAGGLGTRLQEETTLRPKPMVEIGGRPILWHIMKHYAHHGMREFVVALGYKGDVIKRHFLDQYSLSGSITIDLKSGAVDSHEKLCEDWLLHLVETGADTQTGGRIKRLEPWLAGGTFLLTYGDGVSDIDLHALVRFHREQGRIATITAVRPPSRFGGLVFHGDKVVKFSEKPLAGEGWINGGFMVFEPEVFKYLSSDRDVLEINALERLAAEGQLSAYRHDKFWQCMDSLRDKQLLEKLWDSNKAPWKVWK